ncbi:MAG TPA: ABC transporter permease [Oceanithermus sp.]|nr:ABC transporter permease [Oceanithermus sp.]
MVESWVVATLARGLAFAVPLLFAALGELVAERAGVINLGVEGMMILGALSAFVVADASGSPWLGVLAAAFVGAAAAFFHAFFSVTLRANQYVSGLALTMVGLGLSGLWGKAYAGRPLAHPLPKWDVPLLKEIPWLGPGIFSGQSALLYLGFVLAFLLWVFLYRTRGGIHLRSVGENPAAADALGINVYLVRYLAVLFGGAMAGVAGAYLSVAYRPSWTEGMTAGMGWIALAIVIFAAWDPLRAVGAAFLFGAFYHLAYRFQAHLAPEFLKMTPYLFTILFLVLSALGKGVRLGAPEALGRPFVRGER